MPPTVPNAPLSRRSLLAGTGGAALAASRARPARAAPTKITFMTDWFAEAEQGGYYQAKALGLYEKAGLDVTIRMGGPQVNGMQLLLAGAGDIAIGYDIQLLNAVEKGLPVKAVAAAFQFDLACIMAHADVPSLAALKGHQILIGTASRATFWPWLKQKYGFTDAMAGVDTFNLQPFLHDPSVAMQGYVTSEPYLAKQAGADVHTFLLADQGYPPYSNTLFASDKFIETHPDAVAAFVKATMEGWVAYFRNPAPGNVLIKKDSPRQTDAQIAYSIAMMKQLHVLDRGPAAKDGVGTMIDARWKATRDFLVKADLLKSSTDYKKAFTTRFTDGLHIEA